MDFNGLDEHIGEGISVVSAPLTSGDTSNVNIVYMDIDVFSSLSELEELTLSMNKRLRAKKTRTGALHMKTLILWCLSTRDYQINEVNVPSVVNDDVASAWEFIETFSVSSTQASREAVNKACMGRSQQGFKRSQERRERKAQPPKRERLSMCFRSKPRELCSADGISFSHGHLKDVMTEDGIAVVLGSEDPSLACGTFADTIRGCSRRL